MAMAVADQAPAARKGPSIVIQLAVLLVMTGAAVGIGWFSGTSLGGSIPHDAAAGAAGQAKGAEGGHEAAGEGHGDGKHDKKGQDKEAAAGSLNPLVLNLAPITTNLAAPSDTWLRLELSVQLDAPTTDPTLADTIHQDLLAFVRTVKLHQIEGASGFQHLKADLLDRASVRTDGHVKAVLIRTLLFE
jgi:flagellar FliL protein